MLGFGSSKKTMVEADRALPGRSTALRVNDTHVVLGTSLTGPWPAGTEVITFAMGCFWGSERLFWNVPGVYATAVGYQGGYTPNPTYEETCTAQTGHTESVRVVYDPAEVDLEVLLKVFWENHDATTLNRQGGDVGTQYRSAVYPTTQAQMDQVRASEKRYQDALTAKGFGEITTEIRMADEAGVFYLAEDYHQGYLHKNPRGYCNHGFCQVGYDAQAHGQVARATLPDA